MKIDLVKVMEKLAKNKSAKVVVCEGWDERVLQAVDEILKKKLAKIILLGNPEEIKKKAASFKVNINNAEIHDFKNSELKKELTEKLVEVRKHKGLTKEEAAKLIEDENYFGCMFAYCGYADAVAGSALCPTAALMRPALQILRKKNTLVSEIAIMNDIKNDRILFGTDISLNIDPSAEDLAQIALNAAECVRDFKIEPKIALLSFSTKGSGGNGPIIQPIRDALKIIKKKDPKLVVDGEMQLDAAVNKKVGKKKAPDSPLKGDANTLVFPNLTSANIFAHAMMQLSDMDMQFVILKGIMKPVGILGRSTPKDTVRNTIISCAMMSD